MKSLKRELLKKWCLITKACLIFKKELLDELQNDFGISASDVSSGSISKDGSGNIVVTSGSLQDSAGASCSAPCRVDSSGKIRDAKGLSNAGLSGSGVMGFTSFLGRQVYKGKSVYLQV